MHVSWTLASFFWTCAFFRPSGNFGTWLGAKIMWKEDLHVCFLDLAAIIFVDLDEFALDLKVFFWTERVFVFDISFCFLDPSTSFVDLGWYERTSEWYQRVMQFLSSCMRRSSSRKIVCWKRRKLKKTPKRCGSCHQDPYKNEETCQGHAKMSHVVKGMRKGHKLWCVVLLLLPATALCTCSP